MTDQDIPLAHAQWEWTPATSDWPGAGRVLVSDRRTLLARFAATGDRGPDLLCSGGAVWHDRYADTQPLWQRLALLLVDFHALVVRDGIDPQAAHREFLKIAEYRRVIAADCEGADPGPGLPTLPAAKVKKARAIIAAAQART